MSTLADWQRKTHAWAIRKEWRGPKAIARPLVADLMLFVSEIAEALEELRKIDDPHHYYETYTVTHNGVKFKNMSVDQLVALGYSTYDVEDLGSGKPEGFGPELADLAIRLLETCEEYQINLDYEIERKMAYNERREIRHGGLLL